jgi:GNAT superfamily N-acetyltransferase
MGKSTEMFEIGMFLPTCSTYLRTSFNLLLRMAAVEESPMSVYDIDPSDSNMMQQWQNMHLYWLHKYGLWEQADQDGLDDPVGHILERGGRLLGIVHAGILVASVAVRPDQKMANRWEVMKLCTLPAWQGRGLAWRLMQHLLEYCIDRIRQQHVSTCSSDSDSGSGNGSEHDAPVGSIFLDTSSKLPSAIRLYQRCGFKIIDGHPDVGQLYELADVYMEKVVHQSQINRAFERGPASSRNLRLNAAAEPAAVLAGGERSVIVVEASTLL